jgi:hypothetical protein
MSLRKFNLGFIVTLSTGLLVNKAGANDSAANEEPAQQQPPQRVSLKATMTNGETVGLEQVRRAYLSYGTNKFGFIIPTDFRMDASNPERIVLSESSMSFFLSVRIVGPLPSKAREVRPEIARDLLLQQHPAARISDEFSQCAANYSGPAFDAQWDSVSSTTQSARIIYLASPAGILEFSLISKPEKFAQGKNFLNFILLTFRSNESGSIDLPVFSDKS